MWKNTIVLLHRIQTLKDLYFIKSVCEYNFKLLTQAFLIVIMIAKLIT